MGLGKTKPLINETAIVIVIFAKSPLIVISAKSSGNFKTSRAYAQILPKASEAPFEASVLVTLQGLLSVWHGLNVTNCPAKYQLHELRQFD